MTIQIATRSSVVANLGGSRRWLAQSPWISFISRRLVRLAISLWVLVTASFSMIHLIPGDPVQSAMGLNVPIEAVNARRHQLGLDQPIWTQYWQFIANTLHGNLGQSFVSRQPVSAVIEQRLPATLELALPGFVLIVLVAVPVGVTMAGLTRGGRRGPLALAFAGTSIALAAIPDFLLAVCLVYIFAVRLGWFPVAGRAALNTFVLPVVSLSAWGTAMMARIARVETLSVLGEDYVRTARAKRLPARIVYLRYALPNALTATMTYGGLLLGSLMAGTVLVENVFAWPGLGTNIVESIQQKDYPMVQGLVLIYGAMILFVNLLVDVFVAVLDRRSTIKES